MFNKVELGFVVDVDDTSLFVLLEFLQMRARDDPEDRHCLDQLSVAIELRCMQDLRFTFRVLGIAAFCQHILAYLGPKLQLLSFFKGLLVLNVELGKVFLDYILVDSLKFIPEFLLQDFQRKLAFVVTVSKHGLRRQSI